MKQVVYHANEKWFISNGTSLEEIDFAYILKWQEEGMEMLIEEGELFD